MHQQKALFRRGGAATESGMKKLLLFSIILALAGLPSLSSSRTLAATTPRAKALSLASRTRLGTRWSNAETDQKCDWSLKLFPARRSAFIRARTTKRFPSPRCASTIQIVRPSQSKADTQPHLQPALLRLSAIISQYFTLRILRLLRSMWQ